MKKRELTKLQKSLGGIRTLTKAPDAIWVIDPLREHLAIDEAKKLRIPIVGILDSNADPDDFHYPIPGNDDAIRSVALLTKLMADAVAEGLIERHQKPEAEGNVSAVEPLAEWERELLEQSGDPAPAPAVVAETPVAEPTADAPEEDAPAVKKPAAKAPAKKPAAAKKEPAVKKEPAAEKEPAKAAAKAPAKKPAAEKKPATKAPAAKTEKK
jgi:small subunit ribosomal protein S2